MAATGLGGGLLVTAAAAAILWAPAAGADSGGSIDLLDYQVAAGGDLAVRGTQFAAASKVQLSLRHGNRRIPLGVAIADERGNFLRSVYLPVTLPAGAYRVLATVAHRVVARAPFELTSALPGSAPPATATVPQHSLTLPQVVRIDDFRPKENDTSWWWAIAAVALAAGAILVAVLFVVRRRSVSAPSSVFDGVSAAILTIGNELVSGDVANSNASWLAKRLEARGIKVVLVASVPDDLDRIVAFVRREAPLVGRLIVTGGLGGTPDDITRESIAAAFGVPREVVTEVADDLRSRFTGDPDYVTGWAALPRGSRPLENPLGGAPGFVIENVWVLPGLPSEMEAMFDRYADEFRGSAPIAAWRRLYRTRESAIAPVLTTATERWPDVLVGSYPAFPDTGPEVEVVLKSSDPDLLAQATAFIEAELDRL